MTDCRGAPRQRPSVFTLVTAYRGVVVPVVWLLWGASIFIDLIMAFVARRVVPRP